MEINDSKDNKLVFFHGSPRDYLENILATTPANEVDEMLDGQTSLVMAGGHTHIQMLRQHKGNLIVNPGSVGFPFKEFVGDCPPEIMAHAEYAIVTMEQNQVDVSSGGFHLVKKRLKRVLKIARARFRNCC
jgi:predicted phosphodiesterase